MADGYARNHAWSLTIPHCHSRNPLITVEITVGCCGLLWVLIEKKVHRRNMVTVRGKKHRSKNGGSGKRIGKT